MSDNKLYYSEELRYVIAAHIKSGCSPWEFVCACRVIWSEIYDKHRDEDARDWAKIKETSEDE